MADFFGAIAAGEIGSDRLPLIFPEPTPKNGVQLPLKEAFGQPPFVVYKKPSTRADLDAQIEANKKESIDKIKVEYIGFICKFAGF